MTPAEENAYEQGRRAALLDTLSTILGSLGYDAPEKSVAAMVLEREAAIQSLRSICHDHGDNDWEENLHLQDIIEKHLRNHLDARS